MLGAALLGNETEAFIPPAFVRRRLDELVALLRDDVERLRGNLGWTSAQQRVLTNR